MNEEAILQEYDRSYANMQTFADRLCMLVKEILASRNVNVHSISFRVKTRNSLKDKIGREGKSYSTLLDITDTIGIRIITYFADDVEIGRAHV